MWNQESNANGSQFIIVYKDSTLPPNYSVFGQVTGGLDVVSKIGTAGAKDGSHDGTPADAGHHHDPDRRSGGGEPVGRAERVRRAVGGSGALAVVVAVLIL